jgi:membrane associated rhomboid family serine protease
VIPLRDNIRSRTVPFVSYAFIGINILVFLFEITLGSGVDRFVGAFGVVPERTIYILFQAPEYIHLAVIPLFTSMFMHGGWFHLLGNVLFLYIFGDNIEDTLGHFRYAVFYIGCGVAASLIHLATHPASTVPTIGASGAIAGVMGAYFLLFPGSRIVTLVPFFFFIQLIEVPAFVFLGIWFLIQFLSGSFSFAVSSELSRIAWWAHIGGFAVGAGYVLLRYGRLKSRRKGRLRT